MKVAIVGASGFVGRALIDHLLDDPQFSVTALSRNSFSMSHPAAPLRFRWIGCDLQNLKDLEDALTEQDVAIYLVHSMLPTARLNQGSFADFDLILADNFARTARLKGIPHVIYLSGLIPEDVELSEHLRSRLEVEITLKAYIPKVTSLRTGIVIGSAGSSFTILFTLVRRLPIMICPRWTRNLCQVISLTDVLRVVKVCLIKESLQGQTWDIGAEPAISYLDMMKSMAKVQNLRRSFHTIPWMSLGLSKLWVRLLSGAPKTLVYPLIDSLKSSMLVRPSHRFPNQDIPLENFSSATQKLVLELQTQKAQKPHAFGKGTSKPKQNHVRSIQRLPLPKGRDAAWVAAEYLRYLPRLLPFLIRVTHEGPRIHLRLKALPIDLLTLLYSPERSQSDRQLFYIVGGILYKPGALKARLEIRETLVGTSCLAAVHDFQPALPWLVYILTQAQVHKWFMHSLGHHLQIQPKVEQPIQINQLT